jgi:hypothetical protein
VAVVTYYILSLLIKPVFGSSGSGWLVFLVFFSNLLMMSVIGLPGSKCLALLVVFKPSKIPVLGFSVGV